MKTQLIRLSPLCLLFLPACEKKEENAAPPLISDIAKSIADADMPILPLTKGDKWTYSIRTEIPAGVTSPTSSAVDLTTKMERMYIGKMKIPDREPEVDVFQVKSPGQPVQHELVEIFDNRVMMRGSLFRRIQRGRWRGWNRPCSSFSLACAPVRKAQTLVFLKGLETVRSK